MGRERSVEATPWTYGGRRVGLPFAADIPYDFRPAGRRHSVIQDVLDVMAPWTSSRRQPPIGTAVLREQFFDIVVELEPGMRPVWAIHRGHHARNPQPSPFVKLPGRAPTTNYFTVHVDGTPNQPLVVRAYPGNEVPPLPWMASAEHYHWPIERIYAYWRKHAYVWRDTIAVRETETARGPAWFRR